MQADDVQSRQAGFVRHCLNTVSMDRNAEQIDKMSDEGYNKNAGMCKKIYGDDFMSDYETGIQTAEKIARLTAEKGGRAYYVGGYVRDRLLGRETKDIDIEVHGITPEDLEKILDSLGQRIEMGKSFGVYGLKGCTLDIAMPRKETATGLGHRDFDVIVAPYIGTEKAAQRRDFTINALMQDVLTGEIIDHFDGMNDLRKGVIRHVNTAAFPEDPLRVLRAAQFAARFDFHIAEETMVLCSKIDLHTLSKERIEGELRKALLKAEKPSVFWEVLREMDQLSVWFPEIGQLIGIPQNPKYHMEGDVWTHTMMVLDEAAKYRDRVEKPFGFLLTALVHDLGKIVCTEEKNGVIHAYEHETKGLPTIREFLSRITNEKKRMHYVLNLAELHMKPNMLAAAQASVKSTNKMFDKAVCPLDLIYIAVADSFGKVSAEPVVSAESFLLERYAIYKSIMEKPYVTGKDLIAAGLAPTRNFSEILAYAHKLRLAGIEKESARKQTLAYARKMTNSEKR